MLFSYIVSQLFSSSVVSFVDEYTCLLTFSFLSFNAELQLRSLDVNVRGW